MKHEHQGGAKGNDAPFTGTAGAAEPPGLNSPITDLCNAVLPFVRAVENSSGRIPTEKLSAADWHSLVKTFRQYENSTLCEPALDATTLPSQKPEAHSNPKARPSNPWEKVKWIRN